MPIDRKLLSILCCPKSHVPLRILSAEAMDCANHAIAQGQLKYVDETPVRAPLTEALITEDGKMIYRVDDDIPVMLPEKGIATEQLTDFPGGPFQETVEG